jgi:hypothetical protein
MTRISPVCDFALTVCCAVALVAAPFAALASTGPASGTTNSNSTTHALQPPAPALSSATRIGAKTVHIVWTYSGPAKNFYVFSFATTSTPPADFASGGWHNDTIVPSSSRATDDSVVEATKPNHNYYLICVAGAGSAYYCSNVVMERPSMVAPAPIQLNH